MTKEKTQLNQQTEQILALYKKALEELQSGQITFAPSAHICRGRWRQDSSQERQMNICRNWLRDHNLEHLLQS